MKLQEGKVSQVFVCPRRGGKADPPWRHIPPPRGRSPLEAYLEAGPSVEADPLKGRSPSRGRTPPPPKNMGQDRK